MQTTKTRIPEGELDGAAKAPTAEEVSAFGAGGKHATAAVLSFAKKHHLSAPFARAYLGAAKQAVDEYVGDLLRHANVFWADKLSYEDFDAIQRVTWNAIERRGLADAVRSSLNAILRLGGR